jgi:hypothetical protein
MVKGCKTPEEAARKLNAELFGKPKLRYSTKRRAPNQSTRESIKLGMASCTGLCIVLADACRAVCVPARLVGTPLWSNKRGNHTWVEVWDKGWHFTGAYEQDPNGLDRGWFVGEASQAQKDTFEHAVYAASFKRGNIHFPLAWDMRNRDVPAENVTDRYTGRKKAPADAETPDAGRSAAAVKALEAEVQTARGTPIGVLAGKDFARVPLTKADAARARAMVADMHATQVRATRAAELKDRVLKEGKLAMPFFYKTFGDKPKGGRSLWISMHGGGGAPARVNDSQYENQKKLYQPAEGIYLAPRAPTNNWNLWHEEHIDRLFTRLIEDLVVLEDVNPDRVYVMGYSAGGDGVYQLAPRMADSWAAAAMMGGHPNGVSLLSLRNVPFALQVGADDSAYNRNRVGREYGEQLDRLQKKDFEGYQHFVRIREGMGHWMNLADKEALPWMATFTRNPTPAKVVWKQTGALHDRSYWLAVPNGRAEGGSLVVAERKGQKISVNKVEKVGRLVVRLDDRMLDLDQPVTVEQEGRTLFSGKPIRTIQTLVQTLADRGDPRLMFDAEVEVDLADSAGGK